MIININHGSIPARRPIFDDGLSQVLRTGLNFDMSYYNTSTRTKTHYPLVRYRLMYESIPAVPIPPGHHGAFDLWVVPMGRAIANITPRGVGKS